MPSRTEKDDSRECFPWLSCNQGFKSYEAEIAWQRHLHARAERRRTMRKKKEASRMRQELKRLESQCKELMVLKMRNQDSLPMPSLCKAYLEALILSGKLRQEKRQLQEHAYILGLATAAIEGCLREYGIGSGRDDWGFWLYREQQIVEQLHATRCVRLMRTLYNDIRHFRPEGLHDGGCSAAAIGWTGVIALQETEVSYSMSKVLYGLDIDDAMEKTWLAGHQPSYFPKLCSATTELEVIERVTPDMFILRRTVRCPSGKTKHRCVNFAFRLQTERGYVLCVRSLRTMPRFGKGESEQSSIMDQFYWIEFAATQDGGCEVTSAGRLNNGTLAYAHERMVEIPISVIWWETEFARPMFFFSPNH